MIKYICITCETPFLRKKSQPGKYCSNPCQQKYQVDSLISLWLQGKEKGWTGKTKQIKLFIRRYLLEKFNSACQVCGWDKTHPIDGNALVEIDHIDGNAENCRPENLRILCPNCHSMTSTFRSRNKNSKRNRKSNT